jgi:YHS domain-containing protein
MQRALWDPVEPTRIGSLRPDLQFRVNGEVYRFSSEKNLHRFMMAPRNWCGTVRDPVSGRVFKPTRRSPEAYWVGGPYYFESDSTWTRFVDDPHHYEIIRGI